MKIVRYSNSGFKPQLQTVHFHRFIVRMDDNMNRYPEHLQGEIKKIIERDKLFFKRYKHELRYGVWAFIDGFEDMQSLNHLSKIPKKYLAEISDDTLVFDVNLTKQIKITDTLCRVFGFYIPESQLSTLQKIKAWLAFIFLFVQ